MYIERINEANDIKKLETNKLPILADEIREEIVRVVSQNGGHLSSNLGAVEITLALHYLMDFPGDKLVFDVGHQSYTHKILTGRREQFDSIRATDGLSGFTNPTESDCDLFYEGHASQAIGEGVGLAVARQLAGENHRIAVVAGDGALTGGLSFEALNNASELSSNLTIILNDNNMSIGRNVGGISTTLSALRTSSRYTGLKEEVTNSLEKIPLPGMGERIINSIRRTKSSIKQMMIPGMFFEDMDIMYLGPVDGHDVESLIKIISQAFRYNGPVVVHAVTTKGKGYVPAMKNPTRFHGTGPFDPVTGKAPKKLKPDYTDAFSKAMVTIGGRNPNLCAITAAMTAGTGLKRFSDTFPDRFFDVGIAESYGLLLATALARAGKVPVVAMYSTFLQRAFDQVLMEICLSNLHVVLAIDRAGIVGADGATHQGIYDISYLSIMPNMVIMAPKNDWELNAMLKFAVKYKGPIAFRYPRGAAFRGLKENKAPIALGKCEPIASGGRILLFALGSMVETAAEVRDILGEQGLEASLVNARFAKPFDREYLTSAMEDYDTIVTLEENTLIGGFGMQVESFLTESGYRGRVVKIGVSDEFVHHGSVSDIKKRLKLDAESIALRIKDSIIEKEA